MTERCLASGGEAEETGHSEESGMEGEVEWSERGELGVGVGWGREGGGGLVGSAGLAPVSRPPPLDVTTDEANPSSTRDSASRRFQRRGNAAGYVRGHWFGCSLWFGMS